MELNEDIYNKLIERNKKAQLYFYRYCFNVMMRVAIRYKKNKDDAASLVNDSFLKVLQNISKYSLDKPLEPWIRRITINTAIDDFRKNKKYKETITQVDTDIYQNSFKTDVEIDADMNLEDMLETISSILPKATKIVFFLKNIDGFSHKEIAEKLGISLETSKWHIKQALKLLKQKKYKLIN